MSAFSLEGGNQRTTRYRGRDPREVVQQGITETPNAPGLVPMPVQLSSGQRMASDLMRAFGVAGDLGQAVYRFATQQQIASDRRDAILKKKQAEIDAAERGVATTNTNTDIQEIERAIAAGEQAPRPGEDVEAFARRILRVDDAGGIGSAVYQERRYEIGAPLIAAALANATQKKIEIAKKEQLSTIMAGAAGADSVDAINEIVAGAKSADPSLPESVIRRDALTRAINYQAEFGDIDGKKLETFAGAAGGSVGADVLAEARQKLNTRRANLAKLQNDQFDEQVATGLLSVRDNQTTFDMLEHQIRTDWNGKVPNEKILQAVEKIDSERKAARAHVTEQEKKAIRRQWDSEVQGQVDAHMMNAADTMGAASMPEKFETEIDLGNGETMTVSKTREEAVQEAVDKRMAELSKLPPEKALPEQVSYLSRNGQTYDLWKRVMSAGGVTSLIDVATNDPSKPVSIPSNAVNGYALWKQVGQANRTIRDRHLPPESDSAKVYELAQIVEEEMGLPSQAALAQAIQGFAARHGNIDFDSTLNQKVGEEASTYAFEKAYLGIWDKDVDVTNASDVRSRIIQAARAYMTVMPDAPEAAIDKAIAKVKGNTTVINGYAVNTSGRIVPDQKQFDAFAKTAIREYVASHPNDTFEEDQLTLVPGRADGTWMLVDAINYRPVLDWNTKGLFTNAQIVAKSREAEMKNVVANKEQSAKVDKYILDVQRRAGVRRMK